MDPIAIIMFSAVWTVTCFAAPWLERLMECWVD